MYKGLLGGNPGRKNQNAQAKQHADELKKAEGSSSKIITEPMYRKVYLTILLFLIKISELSVLSFTLVIGVP